ncbi:helix-turn-helix transcriptional regulator [Streptococcus thermophilus]|uniref:RggC1 n=1 Tax=Streptococcus thermophilus TaxID=1308 RepID=Q5UW33_STRTR|nr:RggC1 [Streptococcus thermophilus]MCE2056928.1 hypothetical protein [Streptococcus thermophilus]MCE2159762.1 hypothetical protein [Streptococcus thermophilus]NDY11516.1 helix-turn-helix transcriptional regulator [Streptococcus thermophilus]UYI02556.1 helix-turn-helix transcriptional regulator [Streptococcus thermophilus]
MKYGKIFKKFRESRGLSLKNVAKSGLSSSHLSRFENDEADLTISKFFFSVRCNTYAYRRICLRCT